MTDIIINGTTVRVGQVWEDSNGETHEIAGVSPDEVYAVLTSTYETFSSKGWWLHTSDGLLHATHLVRCVYPPSSVEDAPAPAPAAKAGRTDGRKGGRKVVQISNSREDIAALCDDGTIWIANARTGWVKHPPIPQEGEQ